jgi:hypothetical protein
MLPSWKYDTCVLCKGVGKIEGKLCVVCNGEGFWEFVAENNYLALKCLLEGETPANEEVKEICDRRLAQVNPDNLNEVLGPLEAAAKETNFDALHQAGSEKWGWAWLHANRFAIELVKLCGGVPTDHSMACSWLAWKWLSEENQKKIDAPIDNPESPVLS